MLIPKYMILDTFSKASFYFVILSFCSTLVGCDTSFICSVYNTVLTTAENDKHKWKYSRYPFRAGNLNTVLSKPINRANLTLRLLTSDLRNVKLNEEILESRNITCWFHYSFFLRELDTIITFFPSPLNSARLL